MQWGIPAGGQHGVSPASVRVQRCGMETAHPMWLAGTLQSQARARCPCFTVRELGGDPCSPPGGTS